MPYKTGQQLRKMRTHLGAISYKKKSVLTMRRALAILKYLCTQTSRVFITNVCFPKNMLSCVELKNFG